VPDCLLTRGVDDSRPAPVHDYGLTPRRRAAGRLHHLFVPIAGAMAALFFNVAVWHCTGVLEMAAALRLRKEIEGRSHSR
jgi:hypothetical protein